MGVIDYTPKGFEGKNVDEDIKPTLCMVWDKLLELEELIRELMLEIRNKNTP